MDSKRGVSGKLPVEIIEHILSFLPVPVLCRMRAVCKTWGDLISWPSFHDLCDLNGRSNAYLFMWREDWRDCACPNSESLFQTNQDYPETLFEIYEVLIAENGRKPVVQLTDVQLQQVFGSDDPVFDVARGFPCFDSNGMCNSVVLVSQYTGQIRRYYLATGSVDVLPPHPLMQTSGEPALIRDIGYYDFSCYYDANTMKLGLRNLLAQRSKTLTSTGWRLLQ